MGCSSSSPTNKNTKKKNNEDKLFKDSEKIQEVTLVPTDVFSDIKVIGEHPGIDSNKDSRRNVDYSNSLSNISLTKVNDSALKVKKYFRNQQPPKSSSEPWTDPLFPPNNNSIFALDEEGNPTDPLIERTNAYSSFKIDPDTVVWSRPKDLFEDGFELFESGISIEDVKQGAVGDCYFLSTISSLANSPQLVLQIFRTLKKQENGCYEVILLIDGEWQVVLVDDWIPCKFEKLRNVPLFAKPVGRELWAMLLEKAYAKVNGGYKNITGGVTSDVMGTITNFPTEYIDHEDIDKEALWQKLLTSSNNGDLINSASKHEGLALLISGLVNGHAYSLIKAKEGMIEGKLVRIVKMRNPWGKVEWKGNWSDNSKLWTEEAKKVFYENEIVVKNDGIFWMGYDEYLKMYYSTQFCYVMSPLFTKTIVIPKETANEPHIIELCVNQKVEVAINGIKPHWRFNRKLTKDNYLQLNMILVKKNTNNNTNGSSKVDDSNPETLFTFIAANQNITPIIKTVLEPGTYLIYTQADFEGAIKENGFDDVYPYRVQIGSSEFFDVSYKGIDTDYTISRLGLINYIKTTKGEELKKKPIVYFQGNEIATMSYGYYFLYNNSKDDYNFSLTNSCQNMAPIFPNSFDIPIKLGPGKSFISFGPKRKFQETLVCQFSLKTLKDEGKESYCNYNNAVVKNMYANLKLTDDFTEFTSGFIFKKINLDFNKLFNNLDPAVEAESFYLSKFPELMKLLLALSKLNDGVKVKFTNKYVFNDGSWSFGETKIDDPKIRHGRTIYQWAKKDVRYVGYAREGLLHGEGTIYYGEGKSKKVLFENGKMKGLI